MPLDPMTVCLDGRDHRHIVQTNKHLMATVAALRTDLIKEALCASRAVQRNVNDGINGCGFLRCVPHQPHPDRQVSLS